MNIGIGAGVVAIAATMAAGVASAATSSPQQTSAAATTTVNKHITRAQAGRIALAKVPHSKIREIQSDDRHDRAVWKVQLSTHHGRVIVDVDKKTGQATIVRRGGGHGGGGGGGGHDNAIAAIVMASRGHDARDNDFADDRGRDVRDHDAADRGDRHGDRHDHDRGHRHDHDRGDDGPGR